MIGPVIVTRIEEGLCGLSFGVDASREVVAATVAPDAGKGKIFLAVATIEGLGENVIEGKDGGATSFRGVAVFAEEVRSFADELTGSAINWHGAWRIQR